MCFAHGSKNIIHIVDFTSPAGTLLIQEINPLEQSKDITCFCKIPQKHSDNLAAAFTNGVIKIFSSEGELITRIQRAENDLSFCMKYIKLSIRNNVRTRVNQEKIVIGSDSGGVAAYDCNNGKTLWFNQTLHGSWVRGLTSLTVKDNYTQKTIILSQAEKEECIKLLDGSDGSLKYSLNNVLDSGLRFKGLCAYQGEVEPRHQNAWIIVAGTCNGTLTILKLMEQQDG